MKLFPHLANDAGLDGLKDLAQPQTFCDFALKLAFPTLQKGSRGGDGVYSASGKKRYLFFCYFDN